MWVIQVEVRKPHGASYFLSLLASRQSLYMVDRTPLCMIRYRDMHIMAHCLSLTYNRVCLPSLRCSDSHLWLDGGWHLTRSCRVSTMVDLASQKWVCAPWKGMKMNWENFCLRSDNRFPTASCSQGRGLVRRSIYHRHSKRTGYILECMAACTAGPGRIVTLSNKLSLTDWPPQLI